MSSRSEVQDVRPDRPIASRLRARMAALGPRRRHALNALLGQFGFAGVAFVGSVVIARTLGAAGRGEYAAWVLAATSGGLIAAGSLPVGLGRAYLAGERGALPPTIGRHGVLTFLLCCATVPIGLLIGLDGLGLVLFVVLAIPAGVVLQDLFLVLQAARLPWLYHGARIGGAFFLTAGATIVWATGGHDKAHEIWFLFTAGTLAAAVTLLLLVRRRFGSKAPLGLRDTAERGRGSYWASVVDLLMFRVDQAVVAIVAGPAALGVYGVAVNWSEITKYFGDAIGQALFEDESTLTNKDAGSIFARTGFYTGVVSLVVAVGGFFLIAPIFGEEFADARWALLILFVGLPARAVMHAAGQMMLARGQGMVAFRRLLAVLVFALPLIIVATYQWGIYGAAGASTVAYFGTMVALVTPFARRRPSAPER
jgi:O-antigen/teichoic acid export membrane protein